MKIGIAKQNNTNKTRSKIKFNCSLNENKEPKPIKIPSNFENCHANKEREDLVWLESLVSEIQSFQKHKTTLSQQINQNQTKLKNKGGSETKVSNNLMCKSERKILGDVTEKFCNERTLEGDELFREILIETTRGNQNKIDGRKDEKEKKGIVVDMNPRNIQKKMDDCSNKKFNKVNHVKSARVQGDKAMNENKMKENKNMKSKSKLELFEALQNSASARKSTNKKIQKTNMGTAQRDSNFAERAHGKIIKNKVGDFSILFIETENNANALNEKDCIEVFSSIEMKTSGGSLFSLKEEALGEMLNQKIGSVKKERCISSEKFSLKKMIDDEEIVLKRKQRRFNSSFGEKKRLFAKNEIVIKTANTENENVLIPFAEDVHKMNAEEDISYIFKSLDGKGRGYLSVDNCNKERISQEMRYVLSPVIERIMEGTVKYSFNQFILEVEKSLEAVYFQRYDFVGHSRNFKREVSHEGENREGYEKELNKAIEIGEFKEDGEKKQEKIIRFATFQDENSKFEICPKFIGEPEQLEAIELPSYEERETDFIKAKVCMKNSILTYDSEIIKLEEMNRKLETYLNDKENKR